MESNEASVQYNCWNEDKQPILTPKASKTEAWSSAPSVTFMTPNVPLGVEYRSTTTFIAFSGKLLASEFDTRTGDVYRYEITFKKSHSAHIAILAISSTVWLKRRKGSQPSGVSGEGFLQKWRRQKAAEADICSRLFEDNTAVLHHAQGLTSLTLYPPHTQIWSLDQ